MQEVENILRRDVEDLLVELRYSLCVNPIQDTNDKLIRIILQDYEHGSEIVFYPENVKKFLNESSVVEPGRYATDTCVLCRDPTLEDVKEVEIKQASMPAHESCLNYLLKEVVEFCKNPQIAVENI